MSPAGDARRRRKRRIIGALSGAAMAAVVVMTTVVNYWPGGGMITGAGAAASVRIDLLASRDLDVGGALPAGGTGDNKPLVSDQTWTRTGGESCYPISSTDASCFAASEVPYTYAATTIDSVAYTLGWVTEPSATNRVLYSTAIDCTNWTCRGTGSATPLQTAPDGSATASLLTVGVAANDIYKVASGYSANALVTMRIWAKCSSGSMTIRNSYDPLRGHWEIDCSAISGAWTLLQSASAAVNEITAWQAVVGGAVSVRFFATSGTVAMYSWAPTITEEPGTGLAVIPTGAAAVSTGDPAWTIDNTSGSYYVAGDTVTQTLSQITGTCWVVSGTDLLLSGAAGSECSGVWYGLSVAP